MEMEVVVPVEFNFDSACSSPYMTAPSSPQRLGNGNGFFFSAPASPTRISAFYRDLNDVSQATSSSSPSSVPFQWEEKPGTPKRILAASNINTNGEGEGYVYEREEDFEFDFSGHLDRASLSAADELFDGGKIKPLKPPPGYNHEHFATAVSSPRSPRSPRPRPFRKKDVDPFEAAIEKTRKNGAVAKEDEQEPRKSNPESRQRERGRDRSSTSSYSSSSSSSSSNPSYKYVHKKSRSLSPFRVSDIMFEEEEEGASNTESANKAIASATSNPKSYVSSILSAINSLSKGNRKWKLKDLLLFRSASEGRAAAQDPLRKYALLSRKETESVEDVKNSSFRSTESNGSVSGSRRRAQPASAHELIYTANRAVAEELRKKTSLPYKHSLLGCLGFSPGMHEISRGIGSLTRG